MAMEYKAAPAEFKADLKVPGGYEGYFSISGNVDDGLDIIEQGSFAKTLQERARRIKVFMAHDWSKLLGPPPDVIHEDSRGLYAKGRLTLGSFWGKEAWELMADGALTEGSIGFETIKCDWQSNGIRIIKELRLFEISPVPLGMNPLTDVQAIKSLRGLNPTAYLEALQNLLHDMKAGARHSKGDIAALNMIHNAAVELGCDVCQGIVSGDQAESDEEDGKEKTANSRAANALTVKRRLRAAELALAFSAVGKRS